MREPEIGRNRGSRVLQPDGWAAPRGYAHGIAARGRCIFVAGQIGWDAAGNLVASDFVGQVRQALANMLAVLAVDRAGPEHLTRLTWYVTDRGEYLASLKEVGQVYREVIGRHYPAMTLVQ